MEWGMLPFACVVVRITLQCSTVHFISCHIIVSSSYQILLISLHTSFQCNQDLQTLHNSIQQYGKVYARVYFNILNYNEGYYTRILFEISMTSLMMIAVKVKW